ncbi:MAG: hypothetical protein JXA62_08550 [Candidatus Aminicenantes bacterium]|nr:hypothetical protein [Candidatus Aminicenantes bacterium]
MTLAWRRAAPFLLLTGLIFSSLLYLSFCPDDYYIYQQYARNLNQTGLPAFNPGEPSYGFTSPLWLGLLGLGFQSTHIHFFPKLLSFLLYAAAAWIFFHFCRGRFGSSAGIMGILLLFLNPWVWRWSLSGMETTAALLCAVLFLYAWAENKKWRWLPLGVLPLLRPELLAWTLAGAVLLVWRKQRTQAFLAVVPAAAWFVAARLIFGQWFPNTAHAKAAGFSLTAAWNALEKTILTLQPVDVTALALALWSLAVSRRLERPWRELLFLSLILVLLFTVNGVNVHTRYLVPLFPLTVTLFLATTQQFSRLRRGLVALSILVSLAQTAIWVYPATRAYTESEKQVNIAIGRWLKQNTSPDARVFLWDIGAIAFESQRRVIDLNGLIDSGIFHRNEPFPQIMARRIKEADPRIPFYFIDVHYKERRAEGAVPGIATEFLFSRPFHHMFIFQKKPLYYSVYRLTKKV